MRRIPDPVQPVAAALVAALAAFAPAAPADAAPAPEVVVETARKLESITLDTERSYAADGQILEREGLRATFVSGSFRALAREDGRIVGLVFEGAGELSVRIPAGVETTSWQAATNYSPLDQPFTAAFLRFSDLTADDLLGEREARPDKDGSGSAFRLHASRVELLEDPTWTRRAPHLLVDRLRDLYGGGAVGGHLLAEFRLPGDAGWLSYYANARGALMEGEPIAWYRVRKRGDAPPLVTVLASFGPAGAAAPEFDVSYLDLDLTFPAPKGSRDLSVVQAKAELGLVALAQDGLGAVVLELASQRPLCNAQVERETIRITKVVDGDGNALAAIHRRNRVVVPLHRTVPRGEALVLHIEYDGPMTQGIPTGPADTMFSELGPWAFYPRTLSPTDRFSSTVRLHLPRFLRGIAPGDLVESDEGKDGWSYVFEEPGGVRTLAVVVGDFVRSKAQDEGANPRIVTWVPRHIQEQTNDLTRASRTMHDLVAGLWGPYPYGTLHVVHNSAWPARNWSIGSDGASGSWSCLPPGPAHPWEPFVERPSGMLLGSVLSPPAFDVIEARAMDRFATEGIAAATFLQVAELTRQWWGHMVPPRTYRDLWLTEAMAVWTGMLAASGSGGQGALRERAKTARDLAVEGSETGLPLALGARLDRQFLFDGWGRGPLLFHALVTELGGPRLAQITSTLVNRSSGPGLALSVVLETLRGQGAERIATLLEAATDGRPLPTIEYVASIDKATNAVSLRIVQLSDPLPQTVRVELVFGPKERETRSVTLDGDATDVRWELPKAPRRVVVDPQGLLLAASLKRGAGDMSSDPEEDEK